MFPKPFENLIRNFAKLPSIGPRLAERLVLYLFRQDRELLGEFAENLLKIKDLRVCQRCFNIAEGELCKICQDSKREQHVLCVVEEPLDIISFERSGAFRGIYHVLGGVLGTGAKEPKLHIAELLSRIEKEKTTEVILATNLTTEGDATAFYLKNKLKPLNVKITRIGRGLATGSDIEYADEMTLSESLTNRKELL